MGSEGRPIKRHGVQSCDSCGRDYDSTRFRDDLGGNRDGWECPYCGFNNAVAMRERMSHMSRCANEAKRKKEARDG